MSDYPLRCHCRLKAETHLRCSRCNVPICPNCSVVAPAGSLCKSCATGHSRGLASLDPQTFAKTVAVALAAGIVGGWLIVNFGLGFGLFGLWFAFLYGGGVAEAALRASGRKRGTIMEFISVGGVVAGLLCGAWLAARSYAAHAYGVPPPDFDVIEPVVVRPPIDIILSNPLFWVHGAIAVFSAVSRIRYV